eukprot:COSAG06_NODE_154_length_21869_cov_31.582637_5_plen_106_part_00
MAGIYAAEPGAPPPGEPPPGLEPGGPPPAASLGAEPIIAPPGGDFKSEFDADVESLGGGGAKVLIAGKPVAQGTLIKVVIGCGIVPRRMTLYCTLKHRREWPAEI